jgi:hypothetical protein
MSLLLLLLCHMETGVRKEGKRMERFLAWRDLPSNDSDVTDDELSNQALFGGDIDELIDRGVPVAMDHFKVERSADGRRYRFVEVTDIKEIEARVLKKVLADGFYVVIGKKHGDVLTALCGKPEAPFRRGERLSVHEDRKDTVIGKQMPPNSVLLFTKKPSDRPDMDLYRVWAHLPE